MKAHLLWFAGFLIALGTLALLFRSCEDRHRFVLIQPTSLSGALMRNRKLYRACLAIVGDVPAESQTMNCADKRRPGDEQGKTDDRVHVLSRLSKLGFRFVKEKRLSIC